MSSSRNGDRRRYVAARTERVKSARFDAQLAARWAHADNRLATGIASDSSLGGIRATKP